MKNNYKVKWQKILLALLSAMVVMLVVYEFWLSSPSPTPKDAILKYCRAKSLTYSQASVKVQETEIVDKDYGRQFIVNGVKGEFGSNILYFYLKDDEKGWKVVCAGTGP